MRGRVPLYLGSMPLITSPQCSAGELLDPPEQMLFHAADAPEKDTKRPAGTPKCSETAALSSG